MKSPEEYLQEYVVLPEHETVTESIVGSVEHDFIRKFLSGEYGPLPEQDPETLQTGDLTASASGKAEDESEKSAQETDVSEFTASDQQEQQLQSLEQVKFVGFTIRAEEFALPITKVQEVIRSMPHSKLPAAPEFIAGIINLRGKVTPLVNLASLLDIDDLSTEDCKFIIVCMYQDLQFGLLVERITTMYNLEQKYIDWNMEAHLAGNNSLITGLIKLEKQLIGVISLEDLIQNLLHYQPKLAET